MEALFRLGVIVRLRDMLSGPAAMVAGAFGKMKAAADGAKKLAVVGGVIAAAGAGITAVGGQLRSGIQAFIDPMAALEDGIAKVDTAWSEGTGSMKASIADVKAASLDWARGHKQSAGEFLDATYMMIAAGFKGQGAIDATRTSLKLATATFGDGAQAAELLGTLYNNLGDKAAPVATEVGRIADMVTKTQQAYQLADLGQLAEGLNNGASSAVQYRVDLAQLLTVLGELNNAGQKGSVAGTGFSAMMRSLGKASESLHFGLAKTATGGIDVIQTLANIQGKFGPFADMSSKAKAKFQAAFGDEGLKAVSLLTAKIDALKGGIGAVNDSLGSTDRNVATVEGGMTGALSMAKNAWTELKITIGEALAPVVKDLIPQVLAVGKAISSWVKANPEFASLVAKLVVFGALAASVLGPVNLLIGGLVSMGGMVGAVLLNPWTLVIAAVAAAVAAIYYHWDGIVAAGKDVWRSFSTFFSDMWRGLIRMVKLVAGAITDAWKSLWGGAKRLLLGFVGWVQDIFDRVAGYFAGVVKVFVRAGEFIVGVWGGVKSFFAGLWDSIVSGVRKTLQWLAELPGKVVDNVKAALSAVGGWIGDQASAFYEAGRDLITSMWDGMKRVFMDLGYWFEQKVRGLFSFLPASINPMANLAVTAGMPTALQAGPVLGQESSSDAESRATSSRGLGRVPVIEVKVSTPALAAALPQGQAADKRSIIIQQMTVKANDAKDFGKSMKQLEQEQG